MHSIQAKRHCVLIRENFVPLQFHFIQRYLLGLRLKPLCDFVLNYV